MNLGWLNQIDLICLKRTHTHTHDYLEVHNDWFKGTYMKFIIYKHKPSSGHISSTYNG